MAQHYRVYYNSKSEAPFYWSFDQGSIDTEIKIKHFVIATPDGHIHESDVKPEADNTSEPRGWVSISCRTCTVVDDVAVFQ